MLVMCIFLSALLFLSSPVRAEEEVLVEEEEPQLSLMEVGAETTISSMADKPLKDVAHLLVEAKKTINRLNQSRRPYHVVSHSIKVRSKSTLRAKRKAEKKKVQAKPQKINAELIPRLRQPKIHDSKLWGTKYPVNQKREYVTAAIVGENGKPYAARDNGIGEKKRFRSPFAKYIHPKAVSSAADVANKDPNTKLNALELKSVNSLQLRLKKLLDKVGANTVWDHSHIVNRKFIADYEDLKTEARTLMEEYEIRTGVKTIAWQLYEPDILGLYQPTGSVKDIYLAEHPEIATRVLQRGPPQGPPQPTRAERLATARVEAEKAAAKKAATTPREQLVNVAWKKQKDGTVKAKVNLNVVDSKVPIPGAPPNLSARSTVLGKKRGRHSKAVQIDVVAPAGEKLKRNKKVAGPPKRKAAAVTVDSAPKINL